MNYYKLRDWIYKSNLDSILLSNNTNTGAIEILKENLKWINWERLSKNPGAIELLKENLDKINWERLSANKGFHPT